MWHANPHRKDEIEETPKDRDTQHGGVGAAEHGDDASLNSQMTNVEEPSKTASFKKFHGKIDPKLLSHWLLQMTQARLKITPQNVQDFASVIGSTGKVYNSQQRVFKKGAACNEMHFIASGRLAAVGEHGKLLCIFHTGQYVGEWALLTDDSRSCDVCALDDDTVLYELTVSGYTKFSKLLPEMKDCFEKDTMRMYHKMKKANSDMQVHLGDINYAARLENLENTPMAKYNGRICYPKKTDQPDQFLVSFSKDEISEVQDVELVLPRRFFCVLHDDRETNDTVSIVTQSNRRAVTSRFTERVNELTSQIRSLLRRNGRENFREQFNMLDSDGNGLMVKEEFMNGCMRMGICITSEEVDMLWPFLDADGSGQVSFEEFVHFASNVAKKSKYLNKHCLDASAQRRDLRIQCTTYLPQIITSIIADIHHRLAHQVRNPRSALIGAARRASFLQVAAGNRKAIASPTEVALGNFFHADGKVFINKRLFETGLQKLHVIVPPMVLDILWGLLMGGAEMPLRTIEHFVGGEIVDGELEKHVAHVLNNKQIDETEVAKLGSMAKLPEMLLSAFSEESHRTYLLVSQPPSHTSHVLIQPSHTCEDPHHSSHLSDVARVLTSKTGSYSSRRSSRTISFGKERECEDHYGKLPPALVKLARSAQGRRERETASMLAQSSASDKEETDRDARKPSKVSKSHDSEEQGRRSIEEKAESAFRSAFPIEMDQFPHPPTNAATDSADEEVRDADAAAAPSLQEQQDPVTERTKHEELRAAESAAGAGAAGRKGARAGISAAYERVAEATASSVRPRRSKQKAAGPPFPHRKLRKPVSTTLTKAMPHDKDSSELVLPSIRSPASETTKPKVETSERDDQLVLPSINPGDQSHHNNQAMEDHPSKQSREKRNATRRTNCKWKQSKDGEWVLVSVSQRRRRRRWTENFPPAPMQQPLAESTPEPAAQSHKRRKAPRRRREGDRAIQEAGFMPALEMQLRKLKKMQLVAE